MTNQLAAYRIWQSPDGVLIQVQTCQIELSVADALALATDITSRLALAPLHVTRSRVTWTPELSAECVRLYLDERLGYRKIGKTIGISVASARKWLLKAGVNLRPYTKHQNLILAHTATAAKRARQVA